MDITDISKDETTNKFDGNDNELYVLNTMMAVLNRVYELLRRGTLYTDAFQVMAIQRQNFLQKGLRINLQAQH